METLYKKLCALNLAVILTTMASGIFMLPAHAAGTVTIVYNGNGGTTAAGSQTYLQEVGSYENVTLPDADLFSDSYSTFLYWQGSDGRSYCAGRTYDLPDGISMTAQWGKARVCYFGNGGTTADGSDYYEQYVTWRDASGKFDYGTQFEREAAVFVGWNTQPDGNGSWYPAGSTIPDSTEISLYAQWEERQSGLFLRYCSNGTDLFGGKSYQYVFPGTLPATVTLSVPSDSDVYTYIGWSTVPSLPYGEQELTYAPGDTLSLSDSTTLYARYFSNDPGWPYIHAIYYGNGGAGQTGSTVKYNSASWGDLVLYGADAFQQPGKYLMSWNTRADGTGTRYEFGQCLELYGGYRDQTVRLYAQWVVGAERYITYIGNGGATGNGEAVYYQAVDSYDSVVLALKDTFTKDGQSFIGWKDQEGCWYGDGDVCAFSGPVMLTAQWGLGRVTYHGNGGLAPDGRDTVLQRSEDRYEYTWSGGIRQNVYLGAFLGEELFLRSGYVFTGWNTQADGSGIWYPAGQATGNIGDLDLYAQWEAAPEHCLRYAANGTDALGGKTFAYVPCDAFPSEVTLMPLVDSAEMTYIGWSTVPIHRSGQQEQELSYAPGTTVVLEEDITLYAWHTSNDVFSKWDYILAIYDGNGGTNQIGSTIKFNCASWSDLALYGSDAFQQEGHRLVSWNTAPDGSGTTYEPGQILGLNAYNGKTVRLFAQWEFDPLATHRLNFGAVTLSDGTALYAAVFDGQDRILQVLEATSESGFACADILSTNYLKMSYAKLFILDSSSLSPLEAARIIYK